MNKFIEKSKIYIDKKVEIKETGKAINGTIKALKLPKNKYIIIVTRTNAIIKVLYTSLIAVLI